MRGQSCEATCGATAFHNALAALGEPRSLEECEVLCKTSMTSGTSVRNLLAAIRAVRGADAPDVITEARRDVAILKIRHYLDHGRPVITLVTSSEPDDHYVAIVGRLGDSLLVADSANVELVEPWTEEEMSEWWAAPRVWAVAL